MEIGTATVEIIPDFTRFDREVEERRRVALAEQPAPAAPTAVHWLSDIAFEERPTGDGRFMVKDSLGWRDPPLTLMAMIETTAEGGHSGAQVAGRMDDFAKDEKLDMYGNALSDGAIAVRSVGEFDLQGERGAEVARMVEDETMRGISVDLAVLEWAFRDPETGEIIDPEEATDDQWEKAFMGEFEFAVVKGEIMAATVCPTPAFADARIAILASGWVRPNVWTASAEAAQRYGIKEGQMCTTLTASVKLGVVRDSKLTDRPLDIQQDEWKPNLTAGGKLHARPRQDAAPIALPWAWLNRPEPDGPCPLTITDAGEVYGHIALWETCHTGFLNGQYAQCIRAPHSITNYAQFHVGEHLTAEGDLVPIGCMTYDTGHADLSRTLVAARRHYDDSGAVGAFGRAEDGIHGIWFRGGLKNNIEPEGVRDMRACPPSGDWRSFEHNLELIACLAVPVPGFPVSRANLALSASASGDVEVTALILSGLMASTAPIIVEHEGVALAALIEGGTDALDQLIQG